MPIEPSTARPGGDATALFPLPSLAVVDARGADAATFLQGQLANDLIGGGDGGGAGRARLAGYCNPKGRLLALPLVLTLADGGLRLLVADDLVESLLQRLRMFVLRADVTFERREALRCSGLLVPADERAAGAPLAHGVAGLPAEPPAEVLDVLGGENGADGAQICRWHDATLPFPCRRYLIVSAEADPRAAAPLADADGLDGEARWRLGDISAGIPRIVAATREAFVPQMVNLQLVGGLSFRKGCYPGQEIVARMQYLGKLKRHMRRFRVASPGAPVVPGDALVDEAGGEAGQVVDAVGTASGSELLAVVRTSVAPERLRLHGATLEPRELPYALPADADADAADGAAADTTADAPDGMADGVATDGATPSSA